MMENPLEMKERHGQRIKKNYAPTFERYNPRILTILTHIARTTVTLWAPNFLYSLS